MELYKNDFAALNKQIKDCFYGERGPGDLPVSRSEKKIFGVIGPCFDYKYCGEAMAWAYKEIGEGKFPELFVILTKGEENSIFVGNSQTPFGFVRTDIDFARLLIKNTGFKENITLGKEARLQLPFLQFVCKNNLRDLKVLCISINEYDENLIKELVKKDISVILASNLTKFGKGFKYEPFKFNKREEVLRMDEGLIDAFLDYEKIKEYCKGKNYNTDLFLSFISLMNRLEVKGFRKLVHHDSGEVDQDYENFISYLAGVFE